MTPLVNSGRPWWYTARHVSRTRHTTGKKKNGKLRVKAKPEAVASKLAEEDLVWHMEHGYQLETDSLGGNPAAHV
jgi:hypothetical protein